MAAINNPPPNHIKVLGRQGWVGLLDHMGAEIDIVNAARVSFGVFRDSMEDRDKKLLKYLIDNKHTSPLEHVVLKFSIHCPLFIRSQWHRHRTWSFNEISRRYTEDGVTFYVPEKLREQSANNRQASIESDTLDQEGCLNYIRAVHREALFAYNKLLQHGVCREQARGVLPQNMMTTFIGTVDLHNLIHFLALRDSAHAQAEIVEYAQAIKQLVRPLFPTVAEIKRW